MLLLTLTYTDSLHPEIQPRVANIYVDAACAMEVEDLIDGPEDTAILEDLTFNGSPIDLAAVLPLSSQTSAWSYERIVIQEIDSEFLGDL